MAVVRLTQRLVRSITQNLEANAQTVLKQKEEPGQAIGNIILDAFVTAYDLKVKHSCLQSKINSIFVSAPDLGTNFIPCGNRMLQVPAAIANGTRLDINTQKTANDCSGCLLTSKTAGHKVFHLLFSYLAYRRLVRKVNIGQCSPELWYGVDGAISPDNKAAALKVTLHIRGIAGNVAAGCNLAASGNSPRDYLRLGPFSIKVDPAANVHL